MAYTPPPNPSPLNQRPEDVLFIDIETVPRWKTLDEAPEQARNLFMKKFAKDIETTIASVLWKEKAGLHVEFNQIVCVSMGILSSNDNGAPVIRLKSFVGRDEKEVLQEVAPKLAKALFLCAHNGKGFDYPQLARKFLMNGLAIPSTLQTMGLKPWEVKLFDTMEMWQFAGFDKVSLDTLAFCFGLPSPKADMTGAGVADLFYLEQANDVLPWEPEDGLKKIAEYCQGDVATTVNVYLSMLNKPVIPAENFVIV